VDPLAGSYFVESLTDRIEAEARELIGQVDALGGAAAAIEQGFFQKQIAESAYAMQKAVESGAVTVVGVNRFSSEEPPAKIRIPDFADLEARQRRRVAEARARRDQAAVDVALDALGTAARGNSPLVPPILEAVRRRATLGEVSGRLRESWGEYRG
jgi:methylmalonyl-CoA mutase N-terminal domain/subunit